MKQFVTIEMANQLNQYQTMHPLYIPITLVEQSSDFNSAEEFKIDSKLSQNSAIGDGSTKRTWRL